MIRKPFREHHLLILLENFEKQHLPLDLYINKYFKANKALGSKDRAEIADISYGLTRWRGIVDFLAGPNANWEKRVEVYKQIDPAQYFDRNEIPLHIRMSFPQPLFNLIAESYGTEKALELCLASNQPAPTTVRINPVKTTREKMLAKWESDYDVSPCVKSPYGIVFHKKILFFGLPEFKDGLFEVQDEGSQLAADLMQVEHGQQVMDYCAGSGGKTLAFAHKMGNTGQIYLHDIRSSALQECRKRLRRSGIQNAQIVLSEDIKLKKLKKQMDWVLVDAPCSGTGTLRRNPDMKWKFNEETLRSLIGQQRVIFERALSFLKPGGKIVYVTCSILKQENQDQVEHFVKTYKLEKIGKPFQSHPTAGGMDGFYGVVLCANYTQVNSKFGSRASSKLPGLNDRK